MLRFLCATVAFCFLFSAGASSQTMPQLSQADNESADPSQLHAPHHSPEATPAPHPQLVDITVDDAASNFCCPVPADDWYVRGEYLIWWLREGRIPSLLTTSSFASH